MTNHIKVVSLCLNMSLRRPLGLFIVLFTGLFLKAYSGQIPEQYGPVIMITGKFGVPGQTGIEANRQQLFGFTHDTTWKLLPGETEAPKWPLLVLIILVLLKNNRGCVMIQRKQCGEILAGHNKKEVRKEVRKQVRREMEKYTQRSGLKKR